MATYLTHFVGFTTWPPSVRTELDRPSAAGFVVGVLGTDPFGERLDEAFREKRFGAHPIVVRRVKSDEEALECHLLFISRSESGRLRTLLPCFKDRPVLTVSDIPGFVGAGGLVGFHEEGGRMYFDINLEGIRRCGLSMSSQLLRLARNLESDGKVKR